MVATCGGLLRGLVFLLVKCRRRPPYAVVAALKRACASLAERCIAAALAPADGSQRGFVTAEEAQDRHGRRSTRAKAAGHHPRCAPAHSAERQCLLRHTCLSGFDPVYSPAPQHSHWPGASHPAPPAHNRSCKPRSPRRYSMRPAANSCCAVAVIRAPHASWCFQPCGIPEAP